MGRTKRPRRELASHFAADQAAEPRASLGQVTSCIIAVGEKGPILHDFERISLEAVQALNRGERIALATVVRVRGSAPRHDGARMLVWPDGRTLGTIGGATLELRVIGHAIEALVERRSRLELYRFSTEEEAESVGLCGGEVEIHIEVLEPNSTLVLIGAGHVAQPLATIAHEIEMRVAVIDDRADYATRERFPSAASVEVVEYDPQTDHLGELRIETSASCFVVVATWGWDEPALAQVLAAEPPPAYVGLVGSPTKFKVIRERLIKRGLPSSRVDSIRSPIGLDLGAETPAEIALSIMAQILLLRRNAGGLPLDAHRLTRPAGQEAG